MKALPLSEKFSLLRPDAIVCLHIEDGVRRCTIKALRKLNRHFIISLQEVTDRDMAALYRGALLSSIVEATALREGEFLYEQIIGLTVITSGGDTIGEVVDIFDTGAHDVYVVRRDEKEYLIPAVKEFIKDIQPAGKRIIVNEMKGLLD
jgi:16S rRNA processing protein RimM